MQMTLVSSDSNGFSHIQNREEMHFSGSQSMSPEKAAKK